MSEKLFARGLIKEVKENGTIIGAIASDGTLDRDEEVLTPEGWDLDNFKKSPVLLWSHDPRQLPIGKVTNIRVTDGKLVFDAKLAIDSNPFAAQVAGLMKDNVLTSFSVGFRPIEKEDNTFIKQELLEISVVNVPANPEARVSLAYDGLMKSLNTEPKEEKQELKVEETETDIRIPVRDCKVTATIEIDRSKGIRALYCGDDKKVRTYIFDKGKDWTIASAQKWVKDHDDGKAAVMLVEKMPEELPEDTKNHLRIVKTSCEELLRVPSKGSDKPKVEKRTVESKQIVKAKKAVRVGAQALEIAARVLKENK